MEISFRVVGVPAPQGSKRHVGRGILVESSKKVKPWRQDVATAALGARNGRPPLDGPIAIQIDFYLPRPKSAPKRRMYPDRKPDIDKLVRSTLDAIVTAGLIRDDGQVCSLVAYKFFPGDEPLGAAVLVHTMEAPR